MRSSSRNRGRLAGLNRVGLRRGGFSAEQLRTLQRAYRALFFGADRFADRLARFAEDFAGDPHVMRIVAFIRSGKRKLAMPRERRRARRLSAVAPASSAKLAQAKRSRSWPGAGRFRSRSPTPRSGRGRAVVLFAIRNAADPARVVAYRHHWLASGSSVSCAGSRAPRDAARWC
jgi:hypothetical protein